ncbi:CNNM domain-containing protein [Stieleria marina]|uniref:Magnesium and cobalt efflux protein CorC n=1 Tax=Stieleria marina TaxID=1930275 RepID=A0A517NPC2_9BACT|nr:Magnesium and cobalt efflux protein CorC [Planctomycetes bacterium K23_9]
MNELVGAWPWFVAMGVLILLSAFFSGSEAALFSLSTRSRRQLARSGAGGRLAHGLLRDPEQLLSAILFWNLLINMTYFAIATIVGSRLESDASGGNSAAWIFTVVTLLTIIFFSEMLPKSVAVLMPVRFSILVGPPLLLAVRLVGPFLPLVNATNQLAKRLIWPTFEPESDIELRDIARAIDLGTDDAELQQRDRIVFHGLVEMAEMRVSEIMRPRSTLQFTTLPVDRGVFSESTTPGGYLMVTDDDQKTITATIGMRLLRPSQVDHLGDAIEEVIYTPWSAPVSQVWHRLDQEDLSIAVVVNEFGEVVGAVSVDDILRRVLAPRRNRDDEDVQAMTIQPLGVDHYRVMGSAALRELAKRLAIDLPDETIATVAGFIQRQTERFPRLGDTATLDRFTLTVVQQDDDVTWIEVTSSDESQSDSQQETST